MSLSNTPSPSSPASSSPSTLIASHYRYTALRKLVERASPFAAEDFEPGADNLVQLSKLKVLIVGAGGLGCELLKSLAYMGLADLHIIDMDTIDLSNLNRQFLFRKSDLGRSKAEVAAEFVRKRVPSCSVTPHYKRIQDMDIEFYRSFNIVVYICLSFF